MEYTRSQRCLESDPVEQLNKVARSEFAVTWETYLQGAPSLSGIT